MNRYYSDRIEELQQLDGTWDIAYCAEHTSYTRYSRKNDAGDWITETSMDHHRSTPIGFRYTFRAPVSLFEEFKYPAPYKISTAAGLLAYAGAMPGESVVTFRPRKLMRDLINQPLNYSFCYQMSSEGSFGNMRIYVPDSKVFVTQQLIRETTGEVVYSFSDIEDPNEWLVLTFTVGNSPRARS